MCILLCCLLGLSLFLMTGKISSVISLLGYLLVFFSMVTYHYIVVRCVNGRLQFCQMNFQLILIPSYYYLCQYYFPWTAEVSKGRECELIFQNICIFRQMVIVLNSAYQLFVTCLSVHWCLFRPVVEAASRNDEKLCRRFLYLQSP